MMPEQSARRFSNEEVSAILQRAIARQEGGASGLTYDDLIDTARELGIDPAQVQAAMTEYEQEGAMEAARLTWKTRRKKKFFEHLRSYIIVNFILCVIAVAAGGEPWFIWPLLGWGIGVAFDANDTFFPKEKTVERGARRILERERGTQRKEVKTVAKAGKSLTIDSKAGKIIIQKGDKKIEIG